MPKLSLLVIAAAILTAAGVHAEEIVSLKSPGEKENYTTGVNIVRSLMQQGGEVNLDLVIKGMQDGLTGEKLLLTEGEIGKITSSLEAGSKKDRNLTADRRAGNTTDASENGRENRKKKAAPAETRKKRKAEHDPDHSDHGAILAARQPGTASMASGRDALEEQRRQYLQSGQSASGAPGLTKGNQALLHVRETRAAARARGLMAR